MKAGSRAGASENPLLLYQPGLSLTRRQEAEQIKQVFYRGKRLGISELAEFFPANLVERLTRHQPPGDG